MTSRRSNSANAWETTLTSQMAPTDLTAVVSTTTGGPASPGYLVIEPDKAGTQLEIVYFDGTFTGTTFVTSGIGNRYLTGSAAASGLTHPVGSKVRSVPTSQLITDLFDYIDSVKTVLTTAGDLPYATAASTWARLAKGTALQALIMNAGATAPQYAASLQSLLTTAGDIITASGANTPVRLAMGSALQVLRVNAGATALEYAAAASAKVVTASKVATSESTSSQTYTALTTAQAISITPVGTQVKVTIDAKMLIDTGWDGYLSFAESGGRTTAAADANSVKIVGATGSSETRTVVFVVTGVTAGVSYTYTLQARCGASAHPITALDRNFIVEDA